MSTLTKRVDRLESLANRVAAWIVGTILVTGIGASIYLGRQLERIDGMDADVKAIKADVASLKVESGVNAAKLDGVRADVTGVKGDVAGIKADVAEIKAALGRLPEKRQP